MESWTVECAEDEIRRAPSSVQRFLIWQRFVRSTSDLSLADRLIREVRSVDLPDWCRLNLALFEARVVQDGFDATGLSAEQLGLVRDTSDFVSTYPYHSEMSAAQDLMHESLDEVRVSEEIISALKSKSQFSLLRVGDGEGRFLADLSSFPHALEESRAIARRIWFWNSAFPGGDFWESLKAAYRHADIVGVNPPFRVDLEYRMSSMGYIGVVSGNRFAMTETLRKKCANWIFNSVQQNWFQVIIGEATAVNFVGAHPQMSDYLSNFGAKKTRVFLTPSDNIVPNSVNEPHYPDIFNKIQKEIRSGYDGIWIISSGVYAKIYSDIVRNCGGVALDIGALSDKWLGLKTR